MAHDAGRTASIRPVRASPALAVLLAALLGVVALWTAVDRRPPEWDHAIHLERALECRRLLAEPGPRAFAEIMALSSFYPPVVGCAAGLAFLVLPVTPLVAQGVMWAFLVAAVLATWGVGRRLLDEDVGLLAAFLLATAPFVVFSLTNFQLDLPLTAMVAVTLYLLVRAEHFASLGGTAILGLSLGAGMLVKPPFAVCVLPAVAWSLAHALRAPDRAARVRRLLLALVMAVALALPWYGPRLAGLPMQVLNRSFKLAAEEGHAATLSAPWLLFYPRVFVPQFGVLAVPLALWGIWALRRVPVARGLVWAALLPLAVFVVLQNKNLRYTLPLLPAAALAAAAGWRQLPSRWRRPAAWALVVVGLVQVSSAAFRIPPAPSLPAMLLPLVIANAPDPRDWRHHELLEAIRRESGGRPVTVAVVPNDNYFSTSNFRYEARRDNLPFRVMRGWDTAPFGVDFAIVKTGDQGPDASSARPDRIMAAFAGGDPYLDQAYPVIARVPLPDQSTGMVRARRIGATALPAAGVARRLEAAVGPFLRDFVRDIEGLRVRLGYRAEALVAGRIDRVEVEAASARVGELRRGRPLLRVREVRLRADDLLVHVRRLAETGVLEVFDVGALSVERLVVTETDLAEFLQALPGRRGIDVRLPGPDAHVRVAWPGPDLAAVVRVADGRDGLPFALGARDVRLGGVRVPGPLVDWLVRHLDPTPRLARLPVPVRLGAIRVEAGRIVIGGGDG